MMKNNPYQTLVSSYAELLVAKPLAEPLRLAPSAYLTPAADAPKALIFSPHPDDECIIGGLPLRLLRERGWHVLNVAVTLGSKKQRQAERWNELHAACAHLGFAVLATTDSGLEQITLTTRTEQPQRWAAAVSVITNIIIDQQPAAIFFPHADDWNRTHIGTHYLLLDALAQMPPEFNCLVIETEFWGAMTAPNLLIESSSVDVADLVTALSLHRGEVARNPYHLRLPAWMIDNVRRGTELVQGQGEAAPSFTFATLYRLRRWADCQLQTIQDKGRVIAQDESLGGSFFF